MNDTSQNADLVNETLSLWDIPKDAAATLINISENLTYLVESHGFKAILRLHRPDYHTENAIISELTWAQAIAHDTGIETPRAINGLNGKAIQNHNGRSLVLFHFIDGQHPDESDNLTAAFQNLGSIAARTHNHAQNWARPDHFTRLSWDIPAVFGETAHWGNWRDAPNVTNDIRRILERVERMITHRLNAFGKKPENYGLIHADMRLANLLIKNETTKLIDFDDCGFGWHLYDFAAAISFIEDHPQIPALQAAWVAGYRLHRPLTDADVAEIDSFIMLRRMALLAWIGSHMEATEPQALAPGFASITAELGVQYLAKPR